MKDKKFFCDYFDKYFSTWKFALIVCILIVIGCTVSFNINKQTYLKELAQYSEEDYNYLNKLAANMWDNDTKALSFSNIPDNVTITDFKYEKNQITFTCTLNKNFWYVSNPVTTVSISQISNDINIANPYKERATNKFQLKLISTLFGILMVLIPVFILYILILVIAMFSYLRKKKYYKCLQ